jgi:hypothetical protein
MKKITHLIIYVTIAAITAICGCRATEPFHSFVPNGPLQDEQSFGDYVVRIYRLNKGSFEILRKGVRVYAAHGHCFQIGSINEEYKTNSLVSIGSDINGDGKPNLVVSEWTGGAHCCFLFHIFEIGDRFRYIQTIDAADAECADFENVDNDDALEFPMYDWTFAYWRTCFASSPVPFVILKYNGQEYEMACDLMRKPSLSHDELLRLATDIRTSEEWKTDQPPIMLWARMLDLIYTGNMDQAWPLVELSWPSDIDGKQEFLTDFKAQLAASPFWKDVQRLNNLNP